MKCKMELSTICGMLRDYQTNLASLFKKIGLLNCSELTVKKIMLLQELSFYIRNYLINSLFYLLFRLIFIFLLALVLFCFFYISLDFIFYVLFLSFSFFLYYISNNLHSFFFLTEFCLFFDMRRLYKYRHSYFGFEQVYRHLF